MATGPKVLGADFDDSNAAGDEETFDVPSDELWLFRRIAMQRRNSTLSGNLEIDVFDAEEAKSLESTESADEYALVPTSSALQGLGGSSPLMDLRVAVKLNGSSAWNDSQIGLCSTRLWSTSGWNFNTDDGALELRYEHSGGDNFPESTATMSNLTTQELKIVRVTVRENATPELEFEFFEKASTPSDVDDDIHDHSGWTQVGTTVTQADHDIVAGTADLHVGARAQDDGVFGHKSIYGVVIYDDIGGGSKVVDAIYDDASEGATSFTERAQNLTVTAESGGVFETDGDVTHLRSFGVGVAWDDGDSQVREDDPVLVAGPGKRVRVRVTAAPTTSDWVAVHLIGLSVLEADHNVLGETVIRDDVTSTFTCPAGAEWVFPHLMGQVPSDRSDTTGVVFEVLHPTDDTGDSQSYSMDDMHGADDEHGYDHKPHARTLRDGMYLEVTYSSSIPSGDLWEWWLIGKEVT